MNPAVLAKSIIEKTQIDLSGLTIAQIIPSMGAGGAEQAVIDVGKGLKDVGANPIVFTAGGHRCEELNDFGIEVSSLPVNTKSFIKMRRNASLIGEMIDKQNICLLHARSRAPAWSGYWASKKRNLPFMCTYHGIYSEKNILKNYYNSVMVRGDAVIANSHYTHDLIQERYGALPKNIYTIPRGIDLESFSENSINSQKISDMRKKWHIDNDTPIILLPGRLTSWKGHEVALKAFAALPEVIKNQYALVFLGDAQGRDQYVQQLQDLAQSLGIAARLRMPGHEVDVPTALATSDIVINCSIRAEAFGRVAVEAQAMGKPVIVSALGPVKETVLTPPVVDEEGRSGWHVEPNNPVDLSSALMRAINMPDEDKERLAKRARLHASENFSTQKMVQSTLSIYANLLGR